MNPLPNIDYSGATWGQIVRWAESELARKRQRNDSVELNPERTAYLRGEIAMLKKFLALPEEVAREREIAPGP